MNQFGYDEFDQYCRYALRMLSEDRAELRRRIEAVRANVRVNGKPADWTDKIDYQAWPARRASIEDKPGDMFVTHGCRRDDDWRERIIVMHFY